jgi:hypothetical protein
MLDLDPHEIFSPKMARIAKILRAKIPLRGRRSVRERVEAILEDAILPELFLVPPRFRDDPRYLAYLLNALIDQGKI